MIFSYSSINKGYSREKDMGDGAVGRQGGEEGTVFTLPSLELDF